MSVAFRLMACGLLFASAAAAAADGQRTLRLGDGVSAVKQSLVETCRVQREQAKTARDVHVRTKAQLGVFQNCECLPAELDKLMVGRNADTVVTEKDANEFVMPALNLCNARVFPHFLATQCTRPENANPQIVDMPAFCKCMLKGMSKLTDAELVADNEAVGAYTEAKRAAAAQGRLPPPRPPPGPVRKIELACSAAWGK